MKRQIGIQIRDYVYDYDIQSAMQFLDIALSQIFLYPSLSRQSLSGLFFKEVLIYVHGSYRINLAQRSAFHPVIKKELDTITRLSLKHYILHPGSWKEYSGKKEALETVANAITFFSSIYPEVNFIIENTPNKKNLVGADIADLQCIMEMVPKTVPLSFCIDTSHAFVAGYQLDSETGLDQFAQLCTQLLGNMISLIHLNDTNDECGSGIDQHVFPGKGKLGISFLKRFFSYAIFQSIPIIIEPPALSLAQLKNYLSELFELIG